MIEVQKILLNVIKYFLFWPQILSLCIILNIVPFLL
jgi:hypothetical protein